MAFGSQLSVDKEHSEFVVDVKATAHSFPVVLNDYTTAIEMGADGKVTAAKFWFSPTKLESDSKKRDKKMRGWLEVETYPEISFELKEVTEVGGKQVGLGELKMHGISQPVEVPFEVQKSGEKVTLKGVAIVDHTNYDLEVITMLFFKVDPELKISFTLVGTLED